jgi:hypothetical protein
MKRSAVNRRIVVFLPVDGGMLQEGTLPGAIVKTIDPATCSNVTQTFVLAEQKFHGKMLRYCETWR